MHIPINGNVFPLCLFIVCMNLILIFLLNAILMKSYESLNDFQLIEKIKDDNYIAFETLFHRYKGKVFYFIVDISGGDYYLAEEIVQQVFVKLWEIRANLNITKTVSAYLFTMSKNYFLNTIAQKSQEQLFLSQMQRNTENETVDSEVEYNLLMQDWEQMIEKMPLARRRVYRMHYIEHLSQREIADRLSLSENTVEAHLKLSNQYIRSQLREQYNNMLN